MQPVMEHDWRGPRSKNTAAYQRSTSTLHWNHTDECCCDWQCRGRQNGKALCEARLDCAGYSWRDADPTHQHYHRCFLVSKDGGAHPPAGSFSSALCRRSPAGSPPHLGR